MDNSSPLDDEVQKELSDIFYTCHRKGEVCRVKLNANGFLLQRESNTKGKSEQMIDLCDIVGSRCIICRKERACSLLCSSASSLVKSVVTSEDANVRDDKKATAPTKDDGDVSAFLYVFAYVLVKRNLRRESLRRERTVLKLRFRSFDTFEENMQEAERWYQILKWHKNSHLDAMSCPGQRFLVMLNPKAGSGKARDLFNQQVVPILNEAEQQYDLQVTKHADYARDFVRKRNLSDYCGIVAVGGDGLFFEILNGLLQRSDWRDAVQAHALGIVPCGSGNGLARSIAYLHNEPYEPKPILGATLTLLSNKAVPMDVVRVELRNEVLYSFLSIGWGLISDIDIESERLRALGYQRFTIWTLHRLISLRTYRGRISYLLDDGFGTSTEPATPREELTVCLKHSSSCITHLDRPEKNSYQSAEHIAMPSEYDDVISLETSANHSFRSRCSSWMSASSRKSTYHSISESIYHSIADDSDYDGRFSSPCGSQNVFGPASTIPSLQHAVPESWTVEEGEFIMVHAAYQTHLGSDCFFVPSAELNDGKIHIIIIRNGISRSQLLNFLIGMSSGTHIPNSNNMFIKNVTVRAFRIEPFDKRGILTVDGECVDFGPLQAEILPGTVKVMVPKLKTLHVPTY